MSNAKLIVALDVPTFQDAERWVDLLRGEISIFKVGTILFTKEGPRVVEMVQRKKGEVFLDLKFHDIPNTVASASRVATDLGVFMMNLHIVSGGSVLKETVLAVTKEAAMKKIRKPLLLGVTLLTHLDGTALHELGWEVESVEEKVLHLAQIAKRHGLDGVVCSPQEIRPLREAFGKDFLIVTPGIRLADSERDDQKRVGTSKEAVRQGADYLVVGRPILESKDPLKTVRSILKEIE